MPRARCTPVLLLGAVLFTACGSDDLPAPGGDPGGAGAGAGGGGGGSPSGAGGGGGSAGSGGGDEACPAGVTCVTSFPFHDERDTSKEGKSAFDVYPCDPSADESGKEIVYRVKTPSDGFLSAAVYDGAAVDVDLQVLGSESADSCVARGDLGVGADVAAGYTWIVADTFVSGGKPAAGPFQIDIGFVAPSEGACGMEIGEMARVGDGGDHLAMPATGPIVKEAHLVTDQEPAPYPSTATDELTAHYALSQEATGLVMHRVEPWAPLEGGSFYGAGIGDPADFPVEHEGWYVNMYWTAASRPPKGTRMILREPGGGPRAVVVAAGYETGPGNLAHVGGTPEETHFYMGTTHLDPMQLGIATDQTLPLGPRACE